MLPLRDAPDGVGFEVLMLHKSSTVAFGGMWVFPGGKVDPEDHAAVGSDPDLDPDNEAAARHAAAREAVEEADLLFEPDELVVFSHWTPPEQALHSNRRFATWFFVGRAPVGEAGHVTIDGGEIHDDDWVRPADMLARREAGEIQLVPPTVVTLHDLARFDSADAVLAAAAARTPFRYLTRVGQTDAGMVTMWEGDAGYETSDATVAGPRHRVTMGESAWVYEDDGRPGPR